MKYSSLISTEVELTDREMKHFQYRTKATLRRAVKSAPNLIHISSGEQRACAAFREGWSAHGSTV